MADEYKVQLEQVEAALAAAPDDADLLKLKSDLIELMSLAGQLAPAKPAPATAAAAAGSSSSASKKSDEQWKVGDMCEAVWSTDGQYYAAEVTAVGEDGTVTVNFTAYNETDSVNVASLRHKGAASGGGGGAGGTAVAGDGKTRAEKEAERERKKRKREKKKEKMAEKEQLASQTQSSWQKFNGSKASKKSKTGFSSGSRESIFRTPDSVDGKVGIGTNNIGGRGMTGDFAKRDKWKLKQ